MVTEDNGASLSATGLSPTVEPASSLAGSAASIPSALEKAEAAQLNLFWQAEKARARAQAAEEAFDLIAPFVAKFAAAASHYDGGQPRYQGSMFVHDPEPHYRPALTASAINPGVPRDGPTIGDLRMLAAAYASAIEARSGETERLAPKGESAVPQADAKTSDPPHPSPESLGG